MSPVLLAAALALAPLQGPSTPPAQRASLEALEKIGASVAISDSVGLAPHHEGGLIGGGRAWEALFDERGAGFLAALGRQAPFTHELRFEAVALEQGGARLALQEDAPEIDGLTAVYERAPGVRERFEVRREGLEHSVVVDAPLGAGDLELHIDLGGSVAGLGQRLGDGTHRFASEFGGVDVGRLTVLDAAGKSAQGDVRLEAGQLVYSAPGAFLAEAVWPVTLDPLIGANFNVSTGIDPDEQPDAAFEETHFDYMVIWRRVLSATSAQVRGLRLDGATLAVEGGTIFLDSAVGTLNGRPRIATANGVARFVVAWTQESVTPSQVLVETIHPGTGAEQPVVAVASSTTLSAFQRADIGGEALGTGFNKMMVVWDRELVGIQASILTPSATAGASFGPPVTIASQSGTFLDHNTPSISRTAGPNGIYAVAYTSDFLGLLSDASVVVINRDTVAVAPSKPLFVNPDESLVDVEIDGGNGVTSEWVAVTAQVYAGTFGDLQRFQATSVRLTGSTVTVGPSTLLSEGLSIQDHPLFSVSMRAGKAFVAYMKSGAFFYPLAVVGLNPADCSVCETETQVAILNHVGTPCISLDASSSGALYNTRGLVLWDDATAFASADTDIEAQSIAVLGSNGTSVDLGGGCGGGGAMLPAQMGAAQIGNGGLAAYAIGIDPAATLALLNITFPQAPLVCGSCKWAPFLITQSAPIFGTTTGLTITIPCNPALVGGVLDLQFTLLGTTATPCALFPNASLSNIVRLTVGT